jgi:hypothetical protein
MDFITRNPVLVLFMFIVCIGIEAKAKTFEIDYNFFPKFINRSVLRAKTSIEIMSALGFLLIQRIGSGILFLIGTHTLFKI